MVPRGTGVWSLAGAGVGRGMTGSTVTPHSEPQRLLVETDGMLVASNGRPSESQVYVYKTRAGQILVPLSETLIGDINVMMSRLETPSTALAAAVRVRQAYNDAVDALRSLSERLVPSADETTQMSRLSELVRFLITYIDKFKKAESLAKRMPSVISEVTKLPSRQGLYLPQSLPAAVLALLTLGNPRMRLFECEAHVKLQRVPDIREENKSHILVLGVTIKEGTQVVPFVVDGDGDVDGDDGVDAGTDFDREACALFVQGYFARAFAEGESIEPLAPEKQNTAKYRILWRQDIEDNEVQFEKALAAPALASAPLVPDFHNGRASATGDEAGEAHSLAVAVHTEATAEPHDDDDSSSSEGV
jgi:hypothetical protein